MRATRLSLLALLTVSVACNGKSGSLVDTEVDLGDDTTADAGVPRMLISDDAIDFGRIERGITGAESFTITNTGTGPLTLLEFTLEVTGEFTVLAEGGLTIPPQGNAGITIKYLPVDYASDDITLTISSDDPLAPQTLVRLEGGAITDADDDGFDSIEAGGGDCDDADPDVYPGALDEWYDGVDSNCDNADDFDQDGDGFQTAVYNDEPAGGGGDCQDNNADMYPGAEDVWYDGLDSDCDGSNDYDQDGDGYDALIGGGSDCDDSDPTVNVDNVEKLNGLDDDCNGFVDDDVPGWNADAVYPGDAASAFAGYSITLGDLDDDGDDDLIVGAYGAGSGQGGVGIYDGGSPKADGTVTSDAHYYIQGTGSSDAFGTTVAYLEQSGAFPEPYLAVGAPGGAFGYGQVYLFLGDDARAGATPSSAVFTISGTGGSGGYNVGEGLSQDLDINGDGIDDLFGYYTTSTATTATPYVWMFYGDNWDGIAVGAATLNDSDARWSTTGGGGYAEYRNRQSASFARGGDGNGDGYQDFLFCDQMVDVDEQNDGAVYALWGQSGRYSNSSATSMTNDGDIIASTSQYERGMSLCQFVGDQDGDGNDEFAAYSINSGVLYVHAGSSDLGDSVLQEDDAWATYTFGAGNAEAVSLTRMGDWNGDGVDEIGVGFQASGSQAGVVYILPSDVSGDLDPDDEALAVIEGDSDYDNAQYGMSLNTRAGDYNGDGAADLIVGDYQYNSGGTTGTGAVFVTFGN